jgi:hypothetical protein
MSQYTTYIAPDPLKGQYDQSQFSTLGTQPTTTQKVADWLNLAPMFANTASSIMNMFRTPTTTDNERELAVQGQFYQLQQYEAEKRQKTILIAAGACIVAIILTVLITRK